MPAAVDFEPRLRTRPARAWERPRLVRVFGADLRSLAAFRIAIALLVLADLTTRSCDLRAHYADDGVLPRSVLIDQLQGRWTISLNVMDVISVVTATT